MRNEDRAREARRLIGAIYEQYKNVFFRYAIGITHNQEMAEDAIHSAFVSILKHHERLLALPDRERLKWCVVIVKNKAIDQVRMQNRAQGIPIEQMEREIAAVDTSMDMDDFVARRELYQSIFRHLDELDPESRQILEMKYCLQMHYREIADQLGVTEKYVDNHIMLAKRKLRQWMKDEVGIDE